jgi:plasmid stabilization system protein ParE
MSRTLRIVERARTDVEDIFNWLVHRSVRGAISWYLAFGRAVEKVATSSAPENCGKSLRQP